MSEQISTSRNPCCNGSISLTIYIYQVKKNGRGRNPCCNGSISLTFIKKAGEAIFYNVVILVVMDLSL